MNDALETEEKGFSDVGRREEDDNLEGGGE